MEIEIEIKKNKQTNNHSSRLSSSISSSSLPGRWSFSVWFRIVCSLVGVPGGGGMEPTEEGDLMLLEPGVSGERLGS